jgi:phosphate:Na+ symporter
MLNDFFEQFDIWRFLAGLGIFIFGMNSLEDAIKQLSARSLKKIIRKSTKGLFRSIFTIWQPST